jgi:PiT family inorganic phosphate transporter
MSSAALSVGGGGLGLPIAALVVLVVALAVAFDYTNGFHDTANAVATVIGTRVLSPWTAIAMSAVLNFVGALVGTNVAKTIGKGIVDPHAVTLSVVVCALVAALVWNLLTWAFGIPSSSSHALIGGILGAGVAAGGMKVVAPTFARNVIVPLLISPPLGLLGGFVFMGILFLVCARLPLDRVQRLFSRLQVLSAAWMSYSHGLGDAQKTMGVITLALVVAGWRHDFVVPLWVKVLAATAMGLGTAGGGYRIIKTVGIRLIRMQPVHGFAAETAAGLIITGMAQFGHPVSTTHVIASSITGVGAARRLTSVRWPVLRDILWAMVLTIPASGVLAGGLYLAAGRWL